MDARTPRGELVTETLPYDGGRQVTAYVPPQPPEAVVFAADGQRVPRWGQLLEASGAVPTLIVGAHGLAEEMPRLHEYSPLFDAQRFSAHEAFFVGDVRGWVAARLRLTLPPAATAVFGVSAGGELALAIGLRHPDLYGVVLAASPGGGYRPPAVLPPRLPRTYLVAGTREPFFLENATRWKDALGAAGAEVVLAQRDAGHGDPLWHGEFPHMVRWAFGR